MINKEELSKIKYNKRLPDESYQDYRKRIKRDNKLIKEYKRGVVFWDSYTKGTYIKRYAEQKEEK